MIQAISFDFDGTLVDSNAIKDSILAEVALSAGLRPEDLPQMHRHTRGMDRYGIFLYVAKQVCRRQEDAGELGARLAAEYSRRCHERVVATDYVAGYAAAMADLAKDYSCYINSATPESDLRRIVSERGMEPHFKGVFGNIGHKRRNLELIAAEAGLEPQALLHVGDGDDDLQAAQDFGCHFVAMVLQESRFSTTPDRRITSLAELPAIARSIT